MLPLLHQFKTFSIFQIARPVFQRLRHFRIVFGHYYDCSGLRVGIILSSRFFSQLILCQWLLAGISEHFIRCWCCCCYSMYSSLLPMLIHSLRVFFFPCEFSFSLRVSKSSFSSNSLSRRYKSWGICDSRRIFRRHNLEIEISLSRTSQPLSSSVAFNFWSNSFRWFITLGRDVEDRIKHVLRYQRKEREMRGVEMLSVQ